MPRHLDKHGPHGAGSSAIRQLGLARGEVEIFVYLSHMQSFFDKVVISHSGFQLKKK